MREENNEVFVIWYRFVCCVYWIPCFRHLISGYVCWKEGFWYIVLILSSVYYFKICIFFHPNCQIFQTNFILLFPGLFMAETCEIYACIFRGFLSRLKERCPTHRRTLLSGSHYPNKSRFKVYYPSERNRPTDKVGLIDRKLYEHVYLLLESTWIWKVINYILRLFRTFF